MDVFTVELTQAWSSITYISLAFIASAWLVGVFGLSVLLEEPDEAEESSQTSVRRREWLKTHVV